MAEFHLGKFEVAQRRRRYNTAFACLAIGLGFGALAGLLTAPKSGKLLRRDVREKYDDARDAAERLGKRAGKLWDRGEELAEAAMRKAEPVARALRRA